MTESIRNHLQEAIQRGYIAAFRILGNADESRDACQEAAAKALASAAQYDTSRPFYPWFYRILKNLCIDRIRQRAHTTPKSDIEIPESRHGAESLLLEHERSHAVLDAVQTLGEEHREVIELRHFQDLSYEEMAEILECPVGTVMSRLYRARKALREALLTNPDFQNQNAHNNTLPHTPKSSSGIGRGQSYVSAPTDRRGAPACAPSEHPIPLSHRLVPLYGGAQ